MSTTDNNDGGQINEMIDHPDNSLDQKEGECPRCGTKTTPEDLGQCPGCAQST